MHTTTLIPVLLLAASLAAQDTTPVVQPTVIPGKFAVAPQPFPQLAAITAQAVPDRPVYGLYVWAEEFRRLREEIRQVGWRQIRFAGPWDDVTMRMVVEDDIEVMMTLGGKKRNAFASDDEFITAFLDKTDAFLTRYGPKGSFFADNPTLPARPITAVEIWNEPNFQYMIPDRQPMAEVMREREALYAKLLPAAHKAIKAKWPEVRVVGFGAGGASAADQGFIANVWKQNPEVARSFDILSTHPYVDPIPPDADNVASWGKWSVAKCLVGIRKTIGSSTTPIWYTELGWAVSKADGGHYPTKAGAVMATPLLQAAYVCRQYALAMRLGVARVHVMFATDTDTYNAGFFLRDKGWRPSARAVQTMVTAMPFPQLVGAISDGQDGYYAWTFTADARKPAAAPPVTMAFNVAGPKHVELPWTAPAATSIDMLGTKSRITATPAAAGTWTLPVDIGPCPVYLTAAQP